CRRSLLVFDLPWLADQSRHGSLRRRFLLSSHAPLLYWIDSGRNHRRRFLAGRQPDPQCDGQALRRHQSSARLDSLSIMTPIAWQGWNLKLPEAWNPLRLEGNYDQGQALFVDLERPRLGLRWQKLSKRAYRDPAKTIERVLREEIGQLAAEEAKDH